MMNNFKELLQASFKSNDTEEWLDVHFTRPIGLAFALFWNKFDVHPNVITIISIFLGMGAGWMFHYPDLQSNLWGVILLMFANFCDSTDGQMARLTGKKTLMGRMLDGFSGEVWFACIYVAICVRLMDEPMPFIDRAWGVWIWVLCSIAGFFCHSRQSSLADYYRQIHLFFLKGKAGSELDSYACQKEKLESLPARGAFWERIFYTNYARYCKSQEARTPAFQKLKEALLTYKEGKQAANDYIREDFLAGSRPLMSYTNLLTFNLRAIVCYLSCLLNQPWIYPLFEITVMQLMAIYMHRRHEQLCVSMLEKIEKKAEAL